MRLEVAAAGRTYYVGVDGLVNTAQHATDMDRIDELMRRIEAAGPDSEESTRLRLEVRRRLHHGCGGECVVMC